MTNVIRMRPFSIRHTRPRAIRAATVSFRRLASQRFARVLELPEVVESQLPATRGECVNGPRPCPLITCKYHLYLDVSPSTGAIKLNFPDVEIEDLATSCALDEVGQALNVTRERVRQLETRAMSKLKRPRAIAGIGDFVGEGPTRRRLPIVKDEEDE